MVVDINGVWFNPNQIQWIKPIYSTPHECIIRTRDSEIIVYVSADTAAKIVNTAKGEK